MINGSNRRIVIDTNVFIAALRSKRGASNKLLDLADSKLFTFCLSTALVIEYESVAKRFANAEIPYTFEELHQIIDSLCAIGEHVTIHFRWRHLLSDPDDERILELAINGFCRYILTYNLNDFRGCERFGIEAITPKEFLQKIGVFPLP